MRKTIWIAVASAALFAGACKKKDESAREMDRSASTASKAQENVNDQVKDVQGAQKDMNKDVSKDQTDVNKQQGQLDSAKGDLAAARDSYRDAAKQRLAKLDDDTVANAVADGHFASAHDSPRYAISMGAELVFEARCVVLLASGRRKAEPVAASLAADPTDAVPISYGQICAKRGGELLYVLDREAAAGVVAARSAIEKRGIVVEDISGRSAAPRVEVSRDPAGSPPGSSQ